MSKERGYLVLVRDGWKARDLQERAEALAELVKFGDNLRRQHPDLAARMDAGLPLLPPLQALGQGREPTGDQGAARP